MWSGGPSHRTRTRRAPCRERPDWAAIASDRAGVVWGLHTVGHAIQDDARNSTRFVVVCLPHILPQPVASANDCTSLAVSILNRTGALHDLLTPLKREGVTMLRFQARQARDSGRDYVFFIDLAGHRTHAAGCRRARRTGTGAGRVGEGAGQLSAIGVTAGEVTGTPCGASRVQGLQTHANKDQRLWPPTTPISHPPCSTPGRRPSGRLTTCAPPGSSNDAISMVARDDGETTTTDGAGEEAAKDIVGQAALGGGIGALLGVAALAIPGVGPFVAAGSIASAAVGGAALTGTAIGAAAGGSGGRAGRPRRRRGERCLL